MAGAGAVAAIEPVHAAHGVHIETFVEAQHLDLHPTKAVAFGGWYVPYAWSELRWTSGREGALALEPVIESHDGARRVRHARRVAITAWAPATLTGWIPDAALVTTPPLAGSRVSQAPSLRFGKSERRNVHTVTCVSAEGRGGMQVRTQTWPDAFVLLKQGV